MIFLLADLPNGLAPPVHMFNWSYNQSMRNWILLPILLITIYWLYRYFKNVQKTIPKRKVKIPPQSKDILTEQIDLIQRNYSSNFMYRDGLHELSSLMKTFFESKTGFDIEEMTSEEIANKLKDKKIISFFSNLTLLQFGKVTPLKSEFDEIFEEAKTASGLNHITKTKVKAIRQGIVRPDK